MDIRSDLRIRIVLGVYVAAFGIGALNHARDFLAYGWRPYDWGQPLLEVFWTSLVLLDLLAGALLLAGFRKSGLLVAVTIMVLDVTANSYALVVLNIPEFGLAVPLQATFLGFVLGSLPFVWPRNRPASEHRQ